VTEVKCGFCGVKESEVERLFSGMSGGVYICDACLSDCVIARGERELDAATQLEMLRRQYNALVAAVWEGRGEEFLGVPENTREIIPLLQGVVVDELWLSIRAENCLKRVGIEFIYELVQKSEGELTKTKNFGQKTLRELRNALRAVGLRWGMTIPLSVLKEMPISRRR
jgi:Bacterial RNA polymerase, alpha chain C terminal domain/ClpX C4-type zinc finger